MSDIRGDQAKHVFSRKTANTALEGKLVEKRRKHGENEQQKMRDIVRKKLFLVSKMTSKNGDLAYPG